jgi:hypothetical protein
MITLIVIVSSLGVMQLAMLTAMIISMMRNKQQMLDQATREKRRMYFDGAFVLLSLLSLANDGMKMKGKQNG